jgi:signal transduction histidine kinase
MKINSKIKSLKAFPYKIKKAKLAIDYTGNIYSPMRLPLLGELDPRSPNSPWWSIQNIQLTYSGFKNFQIYGGVKNLLNWTPNKGNPFIIENVQALDDENELKKILAPQSIKSLITVPIMNDDVCYGFVGFDYVYNYSDISEKEYEVLAMYSKILNSLEIRKRYEKELIETNNALETKVKLTTEDLLLKEKKHSLALQQHIVDLEEILFALSHKFRQPVTNILGLSNLLDFPLDSDDKVKEINGYLKKSAKLLDSYTHELTQLAHERKNKKIL